MPASGGPGAGFLHACRGNRSLPLRTFSLLFRSGFDPPHLFLHLDEVLFNLGRLIELDLVELLVFLWRHRG